MARWVWYGLVAIVLAGMMVIAVLYALAQRPWRVSTELERIEFVLENAGYQIVVPKGSRLDRFQRPGCVTIQRPPERLVIFLELCASGAIPGEYTRRTTPKDGMRLRYNVDHDIGGGSGGTEGELKGELVFNDRIFALTCHDQSEWGTKPDWCLDYLRYLEVRGRR